ncbi:MAG: c-type cytochrome [Myxococcota bacterium]
MARSRAGAPFDAGLALFHEAAPSGVACATCHVDGADDAHTWQFAGQGARRTQPLGGGLRATAPFHWDGALADLTALFLDTGVLRMGLPPAEPQQIEALGAWLDGLPAAPPSSDVDDAAGAALFVSAGCTGCHEPPGAGSVDVGTGGAFQAPPLRGLEARLPLMHDGCADTLEARFDPACGGADHGAPLTPDQIAHLVAHLRAR